MTRLEIELTKKIADLEERIRRLESSPPGNHYHYYQPPTYVPAYPGYMPAPFNPTVPWCAAIGVGPSAS